jgi:4-amino-4-deoxy-L-arabinose transferase-like glycosyltransferase
VIFIPLSLSRLTRHTRVLTLQLTTRRAAPGAAVIAALMVTLIGALYLADLSGMGLVSKDEPRYADIGRAMAKTGDWITPRLWGEPWFEKPPLLYWMIALGFQAGLGPDLAPRLPLALFSLAFLAFFWFRVRAVWDDRVATFSTGILATTAGWLALSHVSITDIPVSALFTAAVLLALEGRRTPSAAALGLAVLAKSLPPLVLFLPVLAVDYRNRREWVRPVPILVFAAVAVPWHVAAFLRNGSEFIRILFIQQQFGRFFSPERQHPQRWWFYLPVLLLLLYPWFPLLAFAARDWRDKRTRTLLAVVLFGMVFFSSSLNKLPAYVLPLIPATCILIAVGVARSGPPQPAIVLVVALLGVLPFARIVVPVALGIGLGSAPLPWDDLGWGLGAAATVGISLLLLPKNGAVGVVSVGVVSFGVVLGLVSFGFLWFQLATFPLIDRFASARPVWRQQRPGCVPEADRGSLYGLQYYAGGLLPYCNVLDQTQAPVVR